MRFLINWFSAEICKVCCLTIKLCAQVFLLKYTAVLSQRQEKHVIPTKSGNDTKGFLKGTSGLTNICVQPEGTILLLRCTRIFLCWGSVGYKTEHVVEQGKKESFHWELGRKYFCYPHCTGKERCADRSLVVSETYRKHSKRSLLSASFRSWFVDKNPQLSPLVSWGMCL